MGEFGAIFTISAIDSTALSMRSTSHSPTVAVFRLAHSMHACSASELAGFAVSHNRTSGESARFDEMQPRYSNKDAAIGTDAVTNAPHIVR
jgi:hypothetical protein